MATTNWNTSADGDWSDPANWSNGVPTSSSDVVISVAGAYTVSLTRLHISSSSINSLTLSDPSATLSIERDLTLTGSGSVIAGAITGAYTFSVLGSVALNSGATIGAAQWRVGGAVAVNENLVYLGRFYLGSGSTLTIASGAKFSLTSASTTLLGLVNGSGTFATAGTTVDGLNIGGTIAWHNIGLVSTAGNLTLGDAGGGGVVFSNLSGATFTGTYDFTTDAGINLGGGTGTYFLNSGLLEKTGGSGTSVISVKVIDTGDTEIDTGTLAFNGAGNSFTGDISGPGALSFGGGSSFINFGTSIRTAGWSIGGGAAVTLNETLSYAGKFMDGAGTTLAINGGDTLMLTGYKSTIGGTISGPGILYFGGGIVTVDSGASITAANWYLGGGATVSLNEDVNYTGTFVDGPTPGFEPKLLLGAHSLSLKGRADIYGIVQGTAKIAFAAGPVTLGGEGSIQAKTLTFTGNTTELDGAVTADTVTFTGGSAGIGGSMNTTTATFDGAVAYVSGTIDATTVTFGANASIETGGEVDAPTVKFGGSVAIEGNIDAETVTIAGSATIYANGEIDAPTVTFGGSASIDGGVNAKTVTFAGGPASINGSLDATTATFTGIATSIYGSLDVGTATFAGGSVALYGGANLEVSNWIMTGGTSVTAGLLTYGGKLRMGSDTALTISNKVTLSGSGSVLSGSIKGGLVATTGGATIQNLAITSNWHNTGTITAAGNLNLQYNYNFTPQVFGNLTGGTYNLTGDFNVSLQYSNYQNYYYGEFQNLGLLEKTGGTGTSTINATFFNTGTVTAASGVLDFTGGVYGNSIYSKFGGTFNIINGATLRFDYYVSSGQTVAFGSGGGVLALGSAQYAGAISGFGAGDAIDLVQFKFNGSETASFTENAANTQGTLRVDGVSLILFGQYAAAGFHLASAGASGTSITYTAPSPHEISQLAPAHH